MEAATLSERLAELKDQTPLDDLADWPTEVKPYTLKRAMADVKAVGLVLALGDARAEKQAETLIERLFKEKGKALAAAMDDTVED